jgi:outer membrane protein OmpA-like peptidoglycan-associated protein
VVAAVAPLPVAVALSAQVLFEFDEHTPDRIRASTLAELDALIARVKLEGIRIESLALIGHADRLNNTGEEDYNQQLSQKRVNTVRDLLAAQGLTATSVTTNAKDNTVQVQACQAQFTKRAELLECLLPNRRVQVEIRGFKSARAP